MLWTLSARLFLIIAVITVAGLALLALAVVEIHTTHLQDEMVKGALGLSDTLRRSTRSSMLKNRKEDVYEIVNTVGAQPGIERIRIFNKEGRIMFSTTPAERGQSVDKKTEACTRCHHGDRPVSQLERKELTRIFNGADGTRVLGLITPVYNEASCSGTACHATPGEQQVLGVIDVQMSLAGIDSALEEQKRQYFHLTYLLMLVIASTCGLFLWRFVHIPVKTLIQGTEEIARGNLNHRIPITSRHEIGRLGLAFNRMASELDRARQQLTDWAKTLEQRVEEKTSNLKKAQTKLIQNEKMASLGALSASVAHEINNPLSGVLTYNRLLKKIVGKSGPPPDRVADILKYLDTMEKEVTRCGKIVTNLLEFSRHRDIVVGPADVNQILEQALFLIAHRLELQEIRQVKNLHDDLPLVHCDSDQIQQALLAVLINAAEAMPLGGELHVLTRPLPPDPDRPEQIRIEISDSGMGIPPGVMPNLFEPFFTTKQETKGVGLGLSVVYGIINKHHGRIDVRSEEKHGATFVITLPVDNLLDSDGGGGANSELPGEPVSPGGTGR